MSSEPQPDAPPQPNRGPEPPAQIPRTRVSSAWVMSGFAIIFITLMLIFILENLQQVKVSFVGASGSLPLAVALLFAALLGALVVLAIGAARILQLRILSRRHARTAQENLRAATMAQDTSITTGPPSPEDPQS